MIPFITNHPFLDLFALSIVSLLMALALERAIERWAMRMPDSSDIEPEDFNGIDVTASTAVELSNMGFDVKPWDENSLQITDKDAITFYMPNDATLQECINRYREKLDQFYAV